MNTETPLAFLLFRISIQDGTLTAHYIDDEPGWCRYDACSRLLVKAGLTFLGFEPGNPKWWIGQTKKWDSLAAYWSWLPSLLFSEDHARFQPQIRKSSSTHFEIELTCPKPPPKARPPQRATTTNENPAQPQKSKQ